MVRGKGLQLFSCYYLQRLLRQASYQLLFSKVSLANHTPKDLACANGYSRVPPARLHAAGPFVDPFRSFDRIDNVKKCLHVALCTCEDA